MKNLIMLLTIIISSCKSQPAYKSTTSSIAMFTNFYVDTLDGYLFGKVIIGNDTIDCLLDTDVGFTSDTGSCIISETLFRNYLATVPCVRINKDLMQNICISNTRNLVPYAVQKIMKEEICFYIIAFEFVSHIGQSGWDYYVVKYDHGELSSFCHSSKEYLLIDGTSPSFIKK